MLKAGDFRKFCEAACTLATMAWTCDKKVDVFLGTVHQGVAQAHNIRVETGCPGLVGSLVSLVIAYCFLAKLGEPT